jgi:hypothetical protein
VTASVNIGGADPSCTGKPSTQAFRNATQLPGRLALDLPGGRGIQGVEDQIWGCNHHVVTQLPPGSYGMTRLANYRLQKGGITAAMLVVGGFASVIRGRRVGRKWIARSAHTPGRRGVPLCPGVWASGAVLLIALVAVFAGGATAWAVRDARERSAPEMPRAVFASRELANAPGLSAFDGRADTAWIVNGPEPATITVAEGRATMIRGLRLHARKTGLFEAWQVVRVACFSRGWPSLDRTFELKNAAKEGIIDVTFAEPVSADRIQLDFVYPVLETPDGQRLRPEQVNPGYTEIEILAAADRG